LRQTSGEVEEQSGDADGQGDLGDDEEILEIVVGQELGQRDGEGIADGAEGEEQERRTVPVRDRGDEAGVAQDGVGDPVM
jgi:hypothetical protein